MNGVCDAGQVRNSDPSVSPSKFQSVRIVSCSEMSQRCAIAISYVNIVDLIGTLQLEICEVDVDDVAFGNFDGFPLMKIVGVVGWEVGRT